MNFIRKASFGELFVVTFLTAASAQAGFFLLGLLFAMLAPGMFNMNGVPATSPVGALVALLLLTVFGLMMNAIMSALGAALVLVWRPMLGRDAERPD